MSGMSANPTERLRVVLRGVVQGVGFRPHVHRLATALGLGGFVRNTPQGVVVEVEGGRGLLDAFLLRIDSDKPPRAFIQSLEPTYLHPCGLEGFEIRESDGSGGVSAFVPPDIATCPDCLRELLTRLTGGTVTRSPTARTAGRATASLRRSRTTGRTPA